MTDVKTVEEVKQLLVENNFINKTDDMLPYLIILGAYQIGVKKRKIKEWLGDEVKDRNPEYIKMWKLAVANKIFIDGRIAVEDTDEGLTDIELGLYGGILLGYFTRS
jgi:hypothetical protein